MSVRTLGCLLGVLCLAGLWGCGTSEPADDEGPGEGMGGVSTPPAQPAQPSGSGDGSGGASAEPGGPTTVGGAGTAATPPTVDPGAGGAPAAGSGAMPIAGSGATPTLPNTIPSARGMCANLDSGWPGDEACLAPPDPAKGFQVHIGPSDYNDAAQVDQFVMEPGDESSECFFKKTANEMDISYMVFEFSGRPGTHHIINTLLSEDLPEAFGACRSFTNGMTNIGSLGGASKAHMPPMPIAPENESLGIPLAAHTQAQHDMHYFNLTAEPILREFWMNIYYVDQSKVTERPNRIRGMGGLEWNFSPIAAGTHMVYPYECPIVGDGRIIQLLGHTHAHGIRETAWVRRASGEKVQVFEQYDYLEPQIFMYDSLTQNPIFSTNAPGAWTGMLDVKDGDVLMWECEVDNDSTTGLRYTNEVQTGEMCNIWGMTVGPTISCP